MQAFELEPFELADQRTVERHWLTTIRGHEPPGTVRSVVRASWRRCLGAHLPPSLPAAPLVLDAPGLERTREHTDWLPVAQQAVHQRDGSFGGQGHILSLFDARGRMLWSEGDAAAREGLAGINFAPGGLWSETVAGTNGPGTALATGLPVHIVGAEHFCQAWHRWHCAAVPVRDPVTGAVIGVLDISGFREFAHPHSLNLAHALVLAIEQMLTAREAERRFLTLARLTDLSSRYPGDASLAVERGGRVLPATGAAANLARGEAEELRETVVGLLAASRDAAPREVPSRSAGVGGRRMLWYPVFDGRTAVGGCLLLERGGPAGGASMPRLKPPRPSGPSYQFADVVGSSVRLREAVCIARAAAANALPVLLLGESGTGKEVFAQAIHNAGDRRHRAFVAVNCAALPRELVESELFGYVGGAYTGGRREGGVGKFEVADGGTLFLDEIGELSPSAQAALLRVLQEGEITKVGSAESLKVDVRVIAATNRDVREAVASGRLRADVFHRLNVLAIELPSLRDRVVDIRALAARFTAEAALELSRPGAALSETVVDRFERYNWPGNVRELKNLIRRLVAVAAVFPIGLADLPPDLRPGGSPAAGAGTDNADAPVRAEARELMGVVATARTMGEAAARLGITRSTLYRRMERLGLRPERVLRPS
jgi:transcriptional regulator of acetoin/glycerol metabolism